MNYKVIEPLRDSSQDWRSRPEVIKERMKQIQEELLNLESECTCRACRKEESEVVYTKDYLSTRRD